ncbi:MAG TPA: hypothetical protein VI362_08315 [Ignavibacteriaceae bacterium]|nr:hypothetical protein [Ignavibacteriaceae bacterium]
MQLRKMLLIIPFIFTNSILGQEGAYEHDGFYLRLLGGAGYAQLTEENVMGSDLKFTGLGSPANIQIGGTISNNFILFGHIGGLVISDPDLEWMGQSSTTSNLSVSMYDVGAGITYYLMPSNFYLCLSLLSSQASLEYENTTGDSEFGFGLNVLIGKEWWVGDDWALGPSLYFYYSTMKDKGEGEDYTINNFSIGVLFSATYN